MENSFIPWTCVSEKDTEAKGASWGNGSALVGYMSDVGEFEARIICLSRLCAPGDVRTPIYTHVCML